MSKTFKTIWNLSVFILILLTGCGQPKQMDTVPTSNDRGAMEAGQVFQGLELPSSYENGLSGILAWPLQAQTYETGFALGMSEEELTQLLIPEESPLEPFLGRGRSSLSLSLFSMDPYVQALTSAFPYSSSLPDRPSEQLKGIGKAAYPPRDLNFMPLEEAQRQVLETLESMGIRGAEPAQTCALDGETLAKELQIYAAKYRNGRELSAEAEEILEKMLAVSFGEDRECYFFSFRLRIGEDPVLISTATDAEKEIKGAELYCLFGPAGGVAGEPRFITLDIHSFPTELDGGGEQPVISPETAAEAVLPQLKESPMPIRIESLEFCYCYYNNNKAFLHPTWVFTLSRTREKRGETWTEYIYYAVDAITGDPIQYDSKM